MATGSTNPGPAVESTINTSLPRSFFQFVQTIAVNFGTVTAVTTITVLEKTLTGLGTGIVPGDVILAVSKPTFQTGLGLAGARVDTSTADTFYVWYVNPTAGSITPTASETYLVTVGRFIQSISTTPQTFSTLPNSVVITS